MFYRLLRVDAAPPRPLRPTVLAPWLETLPESLGMGRGDGLVVLKGSVEMVKPPAAFLH